MLDLGGTSDASESTVTMAVGAYFAGVALALCTTFMSALGMTLQKMTHKRLAAARERARRASAAAEVREAAETVLPQPFSGTGSTGSSKVTPKTVVTAQQQQQPAEPVPSTNADGARRAKEEAAIARRHARELRSWRQPLWLAGISLMLVSSLLSLAVFALVGQAVASSFAAITLVWNAGLGYFLLREKLTRLDVIVTMILIVGAVTTVVFGAQRDPDSTQAFLDRDTINEYFTSQRVYIFSALYGAVVAAVLVAVATIDKRWRADLFVSKSYWNATAFGRAFLAGTFSATTGLCSKGFTSLISSTGKDGDGSMNFLNPDFWLFLVFLPISLVLQVTYLNSALRYFDATLVVPIYQSLIVVLGSVFGFVYWNEAAQLGANVAGFIAGVLIIVFGLCLLLLKKKPSEELGTGLPLTEVFAAALGSVGLLDLREKAGGMRRVKSDSALPRTSRAGAHSSVSTAYEATSSPVQEDELQAHESLLRQRRPQRAPTERGQVAGAGTGEAVRQQSLPRTDTSSPPLQCMVVVPLPRGYGRVLQVESSQCGKGDVEPEGGDTGLPCMRTLRAVIAQVKSSDGTVRDVLTLSTDKIAPERERANAPSPVRSPTEQDTGEREEGETMPQAVAGAAGLPAPVKLDEHACAPLARTQPALHIDIRIPTHACTLSDLARDARMRRVMWALHAGGIHVAAPAPLPVAVSASLARMRARQWYEAMAVQALQPGQWVDPHGRRQRHGTAGEGGGGGAETSGGPAISATDSVHNVPAVEMEPHFMRHIARHGRSLPRAQVAVIPLLAHSRKRQQMHAAVGAENARGPSTWASRFVQSSVSRRVFGARGSWTGTVPVPAPSERMTEDAGAGAGVELPDMPIQRQLAPVPVQPSHGRRGSGGDGSDSSSDPGPPLLDTIQPQFMGVGAGDELGTAPPSARFRAESMAWLLSSMDPQAAAAAGTGSAMQVAAHPPSSRPPEGIDEGEGGQGGPPVQVAVQASVHHGTSAMDHPSPSVPMPEDNMVMGVGVVPSGFSLPVQLDLSTQQGVRDKARRSAQPTVDPSLVLSVIRAAMVRVKTSKRGHVLQ